MNDGTYRPGGVGRLAPWERKDLRSVDGKGPLRGTLRVDDEGKPVGRMPKNALEEIACFLCDQPTPYHRILDQGLAGRTKALVGKERAEIGIVCGACKTKVEMELDTHAGRAKVTIERSR